MAIVTGDAAYIGDGTLTGKMGFTVSYVKMLTYMMSNTIDLINATLMNRDQLDSGVAVYYKPLGTNTRDYTRGTQPDNEYAVETIPVPLDKEKEFSAQIETNDLARMGAKLRDGNISVADSVINAMIDVKAKKIHGYLFAKTMQIVVKGAIQSGIIPLILPANPTADDYRQIIWKRIANIKASLTSMVTDAYTGIDPNELYLWVSSAFKNEIILALANLGSNISSETLRDGRVEMIGGLKVVECPFLGGTYNADLRSGFDQNESFVFKDCDAVLVYQGAVAVPFNMVDSGTVKLQAQFNIKNYSKFIVNKDGGALLYPELIKGFKLTQDTVLSQYLVNTDLFYQVFAGATPTTSELVRMVQEFNPYFDGTMVTWSEITATSAKATPVAPLTGDPITVTYVKSI